jgi:hypothetical protein
MIDGESHDQGKQQFSGQELANELLAVQVDQEHDMNVASSIETEGADAEERFKVIEGLSDVHAGSIEPGQDFRFLITAVVQASPQEAGSWLYGEGNGFRATDRPVNTSLIDRDHNWTFGGENGFILTPPIRGSDIIAAKSTDFGSNDMDPQPIEHTSTQLLDQTVPTSYNQINITSGCLKGVYIRQDELGNDLGNTRTNDGLRHFANEHGLPVIEMPVVPQLLEAGPASMQELDAKAGNRLWKVDLPADGVRREIDIIKFATGETAHGMWLDENGYDLRIQELDPYGQSTNIVEQADKMADIRSQVEVLMANTGPDDHKALKFVLKRLDAVYDQQS